MGQALWDSSLIDTTTPLGAPLAIIRSSLGTPVLGAASNSVGGLSVSSTLKILSTGTATAAGNYYSNQFQLHGSYWDGAAAQDDYWSAQVALGVGTAPTSLLRFQHVGSPGGGQVQFMSGGIVRVLDPTPCTSLSTGAFQCFPGGAALGSLYCGQQNTGAGAFGTSATFSCIAASASTVNGIAADLRNSGGGGMIGLNLMAVQGAAGAPTCYGIYLTAACNIVAGGTITTAEGLHSVVSAGYAASITSAYTLRAASATVSTGAVGTVYGVYCDPQTIGTTNNWAVYTAGTTPSSFGGNVGIGTTAPKSKLHVVGLAVYANNAAAITGGLTAGAFYRTGADPDQVMVVH